MSKLFASNIPQATAMVVPGTCIKREDHGRAGGFM